MPFIAASMAVKFPVIVILPVPLPETALKPDTSFKYKSPKAREAYISTSSVVEASASSVISK